MPRPRTGSTYIKDSIRQIRITTDREGAPKPRWSKPCPPNPDGTPMSKLDAGTVARNLQHEYDAGRWDPWAKPAIATIASKATEELTRDYAVRWFAARVAKGLHGVTSDRYRFSAHVQPIIGSVSIAKVTRAQVEDVVTALDAKIQEDVIRPKTAQNVWGLVTKMFRDARGAKSRALRVRQDNPCIDVAGPDRGPERSGPYLYPSEFLALVACEQVPLLWRRTIALAVYTYTRAGELEALQWADIDLAHDTIHVHASLDYKTGERREVKTHAGNRRIPIEPALRPLLVAMHTEVEGKGSVVPEMPDRRHGAGMLRDALQTAGLDRVALFANDRTRRPLSFHDLRATGTTWCAVRGDEPLRIMQRAGHTEFKTTQGYIREAENLKAGFGTVFPPLPECLLGGLATGLATLEIRENDSTAENMGIDPVRGRGVEPAIASPGCSNMHEAAGSEGQSDHHEPPGNSLATGLATPVALQINLIYPRFSVCPRCSRPARPLALRQERS